MSVAIDVHVIVPLCIMMKHVLSMCDHARILQPVCFWINLSQSSALLCNHDLTIDDLTIRTNPMLHRLCVLQIPLVGMADELEAQLLESLDKRAAVGVDALPSAAFYTFVNSHHTLNCVTSSSDGACVAGQLAPSLLVARSAYVVTHWHGSA